MSSTNELVIDASAMVALLSDGGQLGDWASGEVSERALFAPELMRYETANILRRNRLAGILDETTASAAHRDLLDLVVHLEPYSVVAERVWELRDNLTVYDACYAALAELREAPLLTVDVKLSRSSGPRCAFRTPPWL